MRITFRDGAPSDAASLDRIFDESFTDTFGHLYRAEDLLAFLSSSGIEDWETQLRDPAFAYRVAEVEGIPVGYVKLGPMKLPIEPAGPALLLDQIYIVEGHRGRGIAKQLMEWTIAEARRRGAAELYLTVFVDNHRARRLYGNYGFEAVGRYDFMVGSHADEDVIMRKML